MSDEKCTGGGENMKMWLVRSVARGKLCVLNLTWWAVREDILQSLFIGEKGHS